MSDIVQLYSDKLKTKKAYPKTLASETYMSSGGTVESQLAQIENKNIEQDTRLKDIEYRNKVQDVYINGFFNENKDGRLSVEGEGNNLKLEGSKEGLVEVERIVGNTFVNNVIKLTPPTMSDSTSFEKIERTEYENYIEYKLINALDTTTGAIIDWGAKVQYPLKDNNAYTLVVPNTPQTSNFKYYNIHSNGVSYRTKDTSSVFVFTPTNWNSDGYFYFYCFIDNAYNIGDTITVRFPKHIMIFEGDYTNKPIPSEYIKGLQSSFEENLVTQEMINEGLENEENLGKYKVPVKLIGKNKASNLTQKSADKVICNVMLQRGTTYAISCDNFNKDYSSAYVSIQDLNGNEIQIIQNWGGYKTTFVSNVTGLCVFFIWKAGIEINENSTIQIEEGTVATTYEDYFERTTNAYLNSPLLEGDGIVMKDGELCHYHNCYKEVFDGSDDENITLHQYSYETRMSFRISTIANVKPNTKIYSDKMPYVSFSTLFPTSNMQEGICSHRDVVLSNVYYFINRSKLSTQDINGFKQWVQVNPITVVYELAQPYYEPIQADKLLLECANDSTLHIESIVPVESVKASYTSNVVNMDTIKAATETTECNNLDINDLIIPYCLDLDTQVSEINVVLDTVMPKTENINIKMRGILGGIDMTYQVLKREIMRGIMTYEDCMDKINIFKLDKKLTEVQAEELTELAEIYLK